jgi:hypothetical protein
MIEVLKTVRGFWKRSKMFGNIVFQKQILLVFAFFFFKNISDFILLFLILSREIKPRNLHSKL